MKTITAGEFETYVEDFFAHGYRHYVAASQYQDRLVDAFYHPDIDISHKLPWSKTHGKIGLGRGQLSLWAGINGHGKSLLLGQVVLGLLCQNASVCIASLEMAPVSTQKRMVRQSAGNEAPSVEYIKRFSNWTKDHLWFYDYQGSVKPQDILGLCCFCNRMGVDHVVIDGLTKCGIPEDDYTQQKQFIDNLTAIAIGGRQPHIHLVCHSRKRETEHRRMDKFDIRGSGTISDMADNVFSVWRNKKKEEKLREGDDTVAAKPDAILSCDKQRHGEWEGQIALWFHPKSLQFLSMKSDTAMTTYADAV